MSYRQNELARRDHSASLLLDLNRMFNDSMGIFDDVLRDFGLTPLSGIKSADFIPKLDMVSNKDGFHVYLEAAGHDKGDFLVYFTDNTLVIKGKKYRRGEPDDAECGWIAERTWGEFQRSIEIPATDVIEDQIKSDYADGVLHVFIPTKSSYVKQGSKEEKKVTNVLVT